MATDPAAYGGTSTSERGGGWLVFAGIALMVAGVMRLFDAIWAWRVNAHSNLHENLEDAIFGRSISTYGWLWLVVAIILFLAGLAVMARNQIARWVGVFAGALAAISAIWWIPYYPVWSLVYIGIGVLVVYGLVAHGGREA
jgi:hypothetical protein